MVSALDVLSVNFSFKEVLLLIACVKISSLTLVLWAIPALSLTPTLRSLKHTCLPFAPVLVQTHVKLVSDPTDCRYPLFTMQRCLEGALEHPPSKEPPMQLNIFKRCGILRGLVSSKWFPPFLIWTLLISESFYPLQASLNNPGAANFVGKADAAHAQATTLSDPGIASYLLTPPGLHLEIGKGFLSFLDRNSLYLQIQGNQESLEQMYQHLAGGGKSTTVNLPLVGKRLIMRHTTPLRPQIPNLLYPTLAMIKLINPHFGMPSMMKINLLQSMGFLKVVIIFKKIPVLSSLLLRMMPPFMISKMVTCRMSLAPAPLLLWTHRLVLKALPNLSIMSPKFVQDHLPSDGIVVLFLLLAKELRENLGMNVINTPIISMMIFKRMRNILGMSMMMMLSQLMLISAMMRQDLHPLHPATLAVFKTSWSNMVPIRDGNTMRPLSRLAPANYSSRSSSFPPRLSHLHRTRPQAMRPVLLERDMITGMLGRKTLMDTSMQENRVPQMVHSQRLSS